ncbi:MAG: hypothetical protein MUF51_06750 [Vicinamibacteria bacterium]|jgi:hypothetical protein|nr:hypothetical protein [Vicinamibacteria bacterium]
MTEISGKSGKKTSQSQRGNVARVLGCLGIVVAVVCCAFVAFILLPGSKTRTIRSGITPGMTVEQVIERAGEWLSCRASAGPAGASVVDLRIWPTSFGSPMTNEQRTFATRAEMARALAAEMGRHKVEWRMTLGYITAVPRRIYFDIDFSSDGRVLRVSPTRWSQLD